MVKRDISNSASSWRHPLARPILAAGALILLAAILSLMALVYLSWSSSQRLDPLQLHLNHLQNLQSVNLEVQSALVNEVEGTPDLDQKSIQEISIDLRNMLRADGYLHEATPSRILKAQNLLLRDGFSRKDNLTAAFQVLQKTLKDENEIERAVITQSREAAEREFLMAMFSLFALPVILIAVLLFFRQRLFSWSASLSEMLENVRDSNLDPVRLPDRKDPIYPVVERYNAMVVRLREIEDQHSDKEQRLEHEVQVASDSLLRVQRHLAQAERLSALGEFSARVAHELRNPLSGITVALRNLREDLTRPEKLEVIDLVLAELDRISRLLNSLLAQTPNQREPFVVTSPDSLCRDMVSLLGYEGDQQIDFHVDVPDCKCALPRDGLRQAILNILRNSAQAMGPGGGSITITGALEGDRLSLAIEDSGPGYPGDILRNGIQPFRSDKDGGSGLGLSILQRLIDNAGGKLRLEEAQAGGARTVIELPCRTAQAGDDGND